jgi:uncharacterized protein YndB with AHSA1/START domain
MEYEPREKPMSDRIERELSVSAPAERVWEAVTGDGWLADEVQLDLRPGGDALFRAEEGVRTGWVEEALAPCRLAFWWASDRDPASRVEITLESGDDGASTTVRVVESRPLELLDLVGIPLAGPGGASFGPALVAA